MSILILYLLPETSVVELVKVPVTTFVATALPPLIVQPVPLVQLLSVAKSPLVTSSALSVGLVWS